jgi:GTPase
MVPINTPNPFKTGYVAIVGRPNVGKSTLVNCFLGQKVAAVSPRPQTTRNRQLAILTLPNAQIIFLDTPGIHNPRHKLGDFMNETALKTLSEVDIIIWMVDISHSPHEEDILIASHLAALRRPPAIFLALNKTDRILPVIQSERENEYHSLLPRTRPFFLSLVRKEGLQELIDAIFEKLPAGEPLYDPEEITDFYEREIAAELIRESALLHLRDEIPHSIAVRIDDFLERGEAGARINATILIEREAHKGIVIGQAGSMLKRIGSSARLEIEKMSGRKIYLELRVKVDKNWRDNPHSLAVLGYSLRKH